MHNVKVSKTARDFRHTHRAVHCYPIQETCFYDHLTFIKHLLFWRFPKHFLKMLCIYIKIQGLLPPPPLKRSYLWDASVQQYTETLHNSLGQYWGDFLSIECDYLNWTSFRILWLISFHLKNGSWRVKTSITMQDRSSVNPANAYFSCCPSST